MHGDRPDHDVAEVPRKFGSGAPGCAHSAIASDADWTQPEIAVFGEWNTTNLGDRAIHQGVLDFFAACGWRVSSFGLGSLTPAQPAMVHDGATLARGRAKRVLDQAPRLKRALRAVRQKVRMRALLPSLARTRAIMVGGGALLTDYGLHFPQSLAVLADAAGRLEKPLLCLGCGTDGDDAWSSRGEWKIRQFLGACSVVATRDHATADRCQRLLGRPVPVFGDFALNAVQVPRADDAPRRVLAINVQQMRPDHSARQCEYEDTLVALANRLLQGGASRGVERIRIFTTGTSDDIAPAQRVYARLASGRAELEMPNSLDRLSTGLRESALVVSSRLHAGALALAAGSPVVSLSPSTKAHHFFSTLGLDDYSFDLEGAPRLVDRVASAGYDAIAARQRDAVARSPVWAGRAHVCAELASFAGMDATCK